MVQRVIAAEARDLQAVCATARRLSWFWCVGLFLAQMTLGAVLWGYSGEPLSFVLLAILAGEYLFMPGGMVQCALAMREGRMKQTAAIGGTQVVAANLATAALVFFWPSLSRPSCPSCFVRPSGSSACVGCGPGGATRRRALRRRDPSCASARR